MQTETGALPNMTQLVIIRCDDYIPAQIRSGLHLAFEALNIAGAFAPGERILIKPNLLSAVTPDLAVTPHPEVFRGLVQNLQPLGLKLSVGDSPAMDSPERALRLSGIADFAEALGVETADFVTPVEASFPEGTMLRHFSIAAGAAAADGLVNLSKLKTHALTGMTGAIKNTFGVIPGQRKARHHVQFPELQHFGQMLVDINLYVRPRLYVMDAIVAMEGNGPRNGKPHFVGLLLVSRDPVLLDAFAASIIGLVPESIEPIRLGDASGLGSIDLQAASAILYDLRDGQAAAERERRGRAFDFVAELAVAGFDAGKLQGSLVGLLSRFGAPVVKRLLMDRPTIMSDKCTRCGLCVRACPLEEPAVNRKRKDQVPSYDYGRCIRCYCCQEVCPAGAIENRRTLLGRLAHR